MIASRWMSESPQITSDPCELPLVVRQVATPQARCKLRLWPGPTIYRLNLHYSSVGLCTSGVPIGDDRPVHQTLIVCHPKPQASAAACEGCIVRDRGGVLRFSATMPFVRFQLLSPSVIAVGSSSGTGPEPMSSSMPPHPHNMAVYAALCGVSLAVQAGKPAHWQTLNLGTTTFTLSNVLRCSCSFATTPMRL